jgi:transglutaminase-like putative cysteine protease
MLYDVRHRTTFEYEDTVSIAHHMLHLKPRNSLGQQRLAFTLNVDPEPSQSTERNDYFGNPVHYLTLQQSHDKFIVESQSRVDVDSSASRDLAASVSWENVTGGSKNDNAEVNTAEFKFASPYIELSLAVSDYARVSFTAGRPVLEAAMDLTSRIFNEFEYRGGVSDVSTPVEKVLEMRQGVCQDFAHLQIACLRSIGLPARYVSGYLLTHPPEGTERMVGADASHAWLSLWSGTDWVDFDPTNNLIPSVEHITVAWGRDYGDVSPTTGFIIGGGGHEVLVAVDVIPVEASSGY